MRAAGADLVQVLVVARTHVAGGLARFAIVALLDETDLLWLALALKRDVLH